MKFAKKKWNRYIEVKDRVVSIGFFLSSLQCLLQNTISCKSQCLVSFRYSHFSLNTGITFDRDQIVAILTELRICALDFQKTIPRYTLKIEQIQILANQVLNTHVTSDFIRINLYITRFNVIQDLEIVIIKMVVQQILCLTLGKFYLQGH